MNKFSIKDIETITGIKSHTIRVWEQRYNLLQTKRSDTNIRYYDDEDLKFLLNVSISSKKLLLFSNNKSLFNDNRYDENKSPTDIQVSKLFTNSNDNCLSVKKLILSYL